jgi:alkylation response protein AidB-like acyl-CoA dehydrogenase
LPTNAKVVASPVDYIQKVRALAPAFKASKSHQEQRGELDPKLVAGMHAAGLFRMLLPAWLNGGALDPLTYTSVIEEIASHDASAAWCVNQGSGCSVTAGNLEPAAAREIFGNANDVLAWGPSPGAKAIATDGGYIVNYKGAFASGSRHATWLGALCLVHEADGTPRLTATGKTEMRAMLFPKSAAEVLFNWNTAGLRGTGSDSYNVSELFVPAAHTVLRDDEASRKDDSPHYRYASTMTYSSGFGHVALGIARGFTDDFLEVALHKTPRESRSSLRDSLAVQAEVAQCRARLASARSYLRACVGDAWSTALSSGRPTPDERVAVRLSATFAIHAAKEVVDTLYDAVGSHAILKDQPFEQRFRDMHAVTQQLQGRKSHFETVGRFMLGLPVDLSSAQI